MASVVMLMQVSGTRQFVAWPEKGGQKDDVPDDEAAQLILAGVAEAV